MIAEVFYVNGLRNTRVQLEMYDCALHDHVTLRAWFDDESIAAIYSWANQSPGSYTFLFSVNNPQFCAEYVCAHIDRRLTALEAYLLLLKEGAK